MASICTTRQHAMMYYHHQEMCNSQTSTQEFRRHSEYDVPLCPFLSLLHRTYFKMSSPSMFKDCLSRGLCFHPYYCGSRFVCLAVDTLQKRQKPTTKHYFRILFSENETRCHFVTMVLVNIYGR